MTTMQLPPSQQKVETFPLLHRRDHFVFTLTFLKYVTYIITVSPIAR